jgi:hypothetical protein
VRQRVDVRVVEIKAVCGRAIHQRGRKRLRGAAAHEYSLTRTHRGHRLVNGAGRRFVAGTERDPEPIGKTLLGSVNNVLGMIALRGPRNELRDT